MFGNPDYIVIKGVKEHMCPSSLWCHCLSRPFPTDQEPQGSGWGISQVELVERTRLLTAPWGIHEGFLWQSPEAQCGEALEAPPTEPNDGGGLGAQRWEQSSLAQERMGRRGRLWPKLVAGKREGAGGYGRAEQRSGQGQIGGGGVTSGKSPAAEKTREGGYGTQNTNTS
jgi:hypothetical protein